MTLSRTLEPEVMDSHEDAAVYDQMDHLAVNQAFVDDLSRFRTAEGDLLDLGTGTARIPIEICRRFPEVRVVATDLATSMLDVARINVEIANLTNRILLVHADSKQLPFEAGRFGLVISNSLLHHIPSPLVALREMIRVTATDGSLFVRDLLRPESAADVERLVNMYTGSEPADAQRLFRESLHAALSLTEIRSLIAQLDFPPQSVQPTSDRHWTWSARLAERRKTLDE